MNHCAGGPATDRFDALAALTKWVEQRQPPMSMPASAGPDTPWPGRTRPLCPYPQMAVPVPGSTGDDPKFTCALAPVTNRRS